MSHLLQALQAKMVWLELVKDPEGEKPYRGPQRIEEEVAACLERCLSRGRIVEQTRSEGEPLVREFSDHIRGNFEGLEYAGRVQAALQQRWQP